MRRIFLSCLFMGAILIPAQAQQKYREADFSEKPVWIEMMHDSTVNYYTAVKAFGLFWKHRFRPEEPGEDVEEGGETNRREKREQRRLKKKLASMNLSERNEFDQLIYEYKLFKDWLYEIKPFVQPDGSIIPPSRRRTAGYQQILPEKNT